MNGNEASDWAEEFKGKDLAYFSDYSPLPGLTVMQQFAYHTAWQLAKWSLQKQAREAADEEHAKAGAETAAANASKARAEIERAAAELGMSDRLLDEAGDSAATAAAPPALVPALSLAQAPVEAEIIPPMPLVRPTGDAAQLLEHQLGTCSALIGNIADYITRASSDPDVCLNFMDRITSMMKSSAAAGKVVGRLRGAAPEETRHRVIVEHAAPQARQGEGVLRA